MKKRIEAKAKAFTTESAARTHKFLVDEDDVFVWDDVAGHYTNCHNMNGKTLKRIKRIAETE